MKERLVTICRFLGGSDPDFEAELARIKLKSNGIQCFLSGKNFVSMYWLLSVADQGIKLQVRESDAEKAMKILENDTLIKFDYTEDNNMQPEQINPPCPKCGSENVEYERFSRKLFFLGILFFKFPLPFPKKKYKCNNCGNVYK